MICSRFTGRIAACAPRTRSIPLRVKLRPVECPQTVHFHLLVLWIALFGCLVCSRTNADSVQTLNAAEYLNVYVRTTDLSLRRELKDSADRTLVDADAPAFQGLDDDYTVYVLHSNSDLWREYGSMNDAVLVDQNVLWFQDVP